ncbi:hypothetical protein [Tenacibaculum sp. M341]|uniref:hypothetical protein n=1 Tax=Tenacibaculum sp. M341 TaxID=2530339 RepID=UPI0010442BE4|nr:hypothetical protein [Tenacibaculum sp. M341]TCI85588.1 hypothetical protein EYW44_16650 [Tenacibaculum sp. M341]
MKKLLFSSLVLSIFMACEAIFIEDISNEEVTIIAPTDGSVLDKGTINFNWNSLENVDKYRLQIAKPSFTSATQVVLDSLVTSTTFGSDLASGEYQWRISGVNAEFETNYTTASFIVKAEDISAGIVTITAPVENSEVGVGTVEFTWNELNDADEYQLQIATPDFDSATSFVVDTRVETAFFNTSLAEGTYQWRIKALNSGFETRYTTTNFTVKPVDISGETVSLTTPANESEIDAGTIAFSWEALDNTDEYQIQIATPNFATATSFVVDETVDTATFNRDLPVGEYEWRVKAINANSETSYTTLSFTVK